MSELRVKQSHDEELVCIAETGAREMDALRMVTGCTAGRGNLVIRENVCYVLSFISWESGKAVRVREADLPERPAMDELREKVFSRTATSNDPSRFQALVRAPADRVPTVPKGETVGGPGSAGGACENGPHLRLDRRCPRR